MKSFQFPLEAVLEWRRTQLELEESKMKRMWAEWRQLDLEQAQLGAARAAAVQALQGLSGVRGADLGALDAYRIRLAHAEQALVRRRQACQQGLDQQRRRLLEAKRQFRLLEKLRERRRAEWRSELNREVERSAAEAHLARWTARRDS